MTTRILNIEDDPDSQQLIGDVLFKEGYEMHYAWNGQEGYEKVLALNPNLIILDLFLPIMDGVEFLQKLHDNKNVREIPVIVVTGFGDETNLLGHSIVALGAADYLRKPLDIKELSSCVREVLANHPRQPQAAPKKIQELRKGDVRADPKFRTVWVNDRLIATLPDKRFRVLQRLMESAGSVRREDLFQILEYEPDQTNALKQTIHRMREDLGVAESRRIRATPDGYEFIG